MRHRWGANKGSLRAACVAWLPLALAAGSTLGQGPERCELDVSWELSWELPPDLDSPVQAPALLAANGTGGVATFDYGDQALKSVTSAGMSWAFGRSGQGPREFIQPTGIALAGQEMWVVDPDNQRLTKVSRDGQEARAFRLTEITRAIRLRDGRGIGLVQGPGPLLKVFDEEGGVTGYVTPDGFPTRLGPMVREGIIAGGERSPFFLVAFLNAGQLIHGTATQDGIQTTLVPTIEPSQFPELVTSRTARGHTLVRVDPEAPGGARWVDHDARFFYVAYEGTTRTDGRLVDLYRTEDASYWGSFLLPEPVASGAIVAEGLMAGLIFEPIPHIKVWHFGIEESSASMAGIPDRLDCRGWSEG